MCVYCLPGWPVLWSGRWSQLWSPGWPAAAGGRAAGDRKPKSFLILWERRPGAPDPDRETRHMVILTKPFSVQHLPTTECVRVYTHMHHERYRLHLHCRRGAQACVFEVLNDTRAEMILGLQLLKCAHRVRYVTAVHIYTVLRANTIHLKSNIEKIIEQMIEEQRSEHGQSSNFTEHYSSKHNLLHLLESHKMHLSVFLKFVL